MITRITPLLLMIFTLLSCAETIKPSTNKLEMTASNFVFNIEIIDNRMPSPTPHKHTVYCIVNVSPKSGNFENNWRIRRFKVNEVSYFTFDDNEFKGKGEALFTNNVREILLESKNKVWMEFESENGTLIEFTLEDPTITTVH